MTRSTTTRIALSAVAAAAFLPASASAAPATVYNGSTNWTIANVFDTSSPANTNRTWLGYSTHPQLSGGGGAGGRDGITITDPLGLAVTSVPGTDRGIDKPYTFGFGEAAGTIDVAAKTLNVSGEGTATFVTHGSEVALSNPHLVLAGDGTGTVHFTGGTKAANGTVTPYDATTALYNLNATNAMFTPIGDGKFVVGGLIPSLAKTEVFGSPATYFVGSGPNRTPNTFGGFSVLVDTKAASYPTTAPIATPTPTPAPTATPTPTPAPTPQVIEKIVEKVVEKPVEKIVEKTITLDKTSVLTKATLTKKAFNSNATLDVTIRPSGSNSADVLGAGYVQGTKLTVFVPKGTTLTGKYVLSRTSGSSKLSKSTTVTISTKKAAKKAAAKK